MALTKYEKETIINFNQDEVNASIYTCDSKWIRDLDKLMKKDSRISLETKDEYSKWTATYIIPKKAVKIRLPRELSRLDAQKLASRARVNFKKVAK